MRTNVTANKQAIYTHEGAVAIYIDPTQQLRRSVMANMLWEDQFYEDGVSIAERIQAEVKEVLKQKDGVQAVAEIAVEARSKMKLRHVPLLLAVSVLRARTKSPLVSGMITGIIQRPDELSELLSIYWRDDKGGVKRQPLAAQLKTGLAAAFTKFSEYELAKWDQNSAAIKLRDVLFLSRAKPKDEEQAALWKKVVAQELATPDTWEVELSAGKDKKEVFTRLIGEKKLGALAVLRNLRNMQQAGVDDTVIKEALATMKTERVLPFRFITAARYAPSLEPQLEKKMFECVEGHEKLTGKTVLVVDVSGSMDSKISLKSELTRIDAACALAMLLREICEDVRVLAFSDQTKLVPARRGFALRDAINNSMPHSSTNTETALQAARTEGYDRCIVITDEQSHQTISGPGKDKKGYFINVASAKNGIGYKAWTHIDGWSEAVVDYITQYERFNSETPAA